MFFFIMVFSDEDDDKFTRLYEKFHDLLLLKALSLLHNLRSAEDAVNEAFIRILKNLDKLCENDSSKTWNYMVVVVTNVSFSILKKEKKSLYNDIGESGMEAIEDNSEPLWSNFHAKEIYQKTMNYVDNNLADTERQIFILRSGHDMSYKEIAEILGLTESNVSVKLTRIRKKIKEYLKREGMEL